MNRGNGNDYIVYVDDENFALFFSDLVWIFPSQLNNVWDKDEMVIREIGRV